ncbi:GIY-YIG nuclease family protein [Desulfurobacterium atlanticum]|uniref:Putative endonuclease n=1 Tax=Desulfurobacterium atlanticum TaxID=240169 RepID=A0A238XQK9_9BACT|nr:GIY-YIG nuclease family protein [Desulfurobacterium atlanticum]SNR60634.1 putative endonuclease [Desulfurobacterium atlanticum]
MSKQGFVYIVTNKNNKVLYIGVTSDLVRRIYQHRNKLIDGFTSKYNCTKLVYYEVFDSIEEAIKREKYLKGKKRQFKVDLINRFNPEWKDLYESILDSEILRYRSE